MSQKAIISESEEVSSESASTVVTGVSGIALSEGFQATLSFLDRLFAEGAGIYLLTGVSGVGKSTALRYAEQHAPDDVVTIIYSFRRIDVDNLSDLLGHTLGVKVPQELPPEARALRYFLKLGTIRSKGKRLILMLDDVQELHSSGAELLKALVNMKDESGPLITVVLCGNSSLNVFLDKSYRWGIQRLIRENHEMAGFTRQELPNLVESITRSPGQQSPPLKSSALETLFKLSAGIPGKVVRLLEAATWIARKHHYRSISSRILRGAETGDFKTLPALATQFTAKAAVAMSLLLLVPATLFQQNLQQQRADVPPLAVVSNSPKPATSETRSDAINSEAEAQGIASEPEATLPAPVIASVADDISPTPSIRHAEEQVPESIAAQDVSAVTAVSPGQTQSDAAFASFTWRIEPAPSQPAGFEITSFNQSIPSERDNLRRMLGESVLVIPPATGLE